jgi:hypothetical protein
MNKPMTWKERILAVFSAQKPDRIPWFPRMHLWYAAHEKMGTLPERYRNWSLENILRDLGAGINGHSKVHSETFKGVEIQKEKQDERDIYTYKTPFGALRSVWATPQAQARKALRAFQVEHMVKGPGDFPALHYLLDHLEIREDYATFEADAQRIGSDGIAIAYMGPSPLQRLLREYMGFQQGFIQLMETPQKVREVLQRLREICLQVVRVVAESPAEIVNLGDNLTVLLQSPGIFRENYLPFYQEACAILHHGGKKVAVHGDGEMKPLLPLLRDSGVDAVESFTPHPMTGCTLDKALELAQGRYIIWGGVPSILLCDPTTEEEFEAFLDYLFKRVRPGDPFVLSVGDNVMPEAHLERVQAICRRVHEAL